VIYQREVPSPGSEGSDEACAVLRVLHRHPYGLPASELAFLAAIAPRTMAPTLKGLKARNRVKTEGHGMATTWMLSRGQDANAPRPSTTYRSPR
jgi:DNA-binding IclR family transcriptional regulator